jgi:multiple sugar transport system permease protein
MSGAVIHAAGTARALPRPRVRRAPGWLIPSLFLAPALLSLSLWVYGPLLAAFRLSFHEWNLLPTAPMEFVGLENYERLLDLPELRRAASNTLVYTVGLLPLTVGLPLLAALMTRELRGMSGALYRALIFVPMVIAPVVVAVIWRWLLAPEYGAVNAMLAALGLGKLRFLQDPQLAIWSIIFITGWKLIGFSTLLFAAALTQVDRSLVEAARLDGASEGQIARRVLIPLVAPAIAFLVMLTLLHGAQWSFVAINVLTQGGPRQATTNLYYLMWEYGFSTFAVGWSTAAGMMLFAVFSVVAALCLRMMHRVDARAP